MLKNDQMLQTMQLIQMEDTDRPALGSTQLTLRATPSEEKIVARVLLLPHSVPSLSLFSGLIRFCLCVIHNTVASLKCYGYVSMQSCACEQIKETEEEHRIILSNTVAQNLMLNFHIEVNGWN